MDLGTQLKGFRPSPLTQLNMSIRSLILLHVNSQEFGLGAQIDRLINLMDNSMV